MSHLIGWPLLKKQTNKKITCWHGRGVTGTLVTISRNIKCCRYYGKLYDWRGEELRAGSLKGCFSYKPEQTRDWIVLKDTRMLPVAIVYGALAKCRVWHCVPYICILIFVTTLKNGGYHLHLQRRDGDVEGTGTLPRVPRPIGSRIRT